MSPTLELEGFTDSEPETVTKHKTIEYDAGAVQRFLFDEDADDTEIVCVFESLSDERFAEYSRQSKTKLTDDGTTLSIENEKPLVDLWNDLAADIEGIEGEKPATWKDEIDDYKYKIPSMAKYLAVAAYGAKKVWGQTGTPIYTDSFFNGKITTQTHYLRKANVDDVRAHKRFQRIPLGGKAKGLESSDITISSYAIDKGKLYDQMKEKNAEGYANDVPLWHKVAVIDFVFAAGITAKK